MKKNFRPRRKDDRPSAFKLSKIGATNAIRKAKAFVVYTIDYDGSLHVEANTKRAINTHDVRELSMKTMESYAHNLSLAAQLKYKQVKESAIQSKLVADSREARSAELREEMKIETR